MYLAIKKKICTLKLKTWYLILSPVFLLWKQEGGSCVDFKMMSVNGVILYEKVRTGTKYLLQSSLLLSSCTHCCYTGLSVMWLTLLHSSLYVVFFLFLSFFVQRGASHVCIAGLWSRCCLSISCIWDISSPQEWRSSWCYIYWWYVIQSEFCLDT